MSWRQTESAPNPGTPISRAINIDADVKTVQASCAKHAIEISAIEPLLSGGTRVVLVNADGAARLRGLYKKKLLEGVVTRTRWVANR